MKQGRRKKTNEDEIWSRARLLLETDEELEGTNKHYDLLIGLFLLICKTKKLKLS